MVIKKISSPENSFYKELKKLYQDSAFRRKNGMFIVEGEKLVFELIADNWPLKYLVVSESYWQAKKIDDDGVKLVVLTDQLFNKISELVTPPGILAVACMKSLSWPAGKDGAFLVLDGLQDPGNVGTLLRAAFGFGVSGVILLPPAVDIYNPKVLRASAGTAFKFPVLRMEADELKDIILKNNIPLFLAESEGGIPLTSINFPAKFFVAVGNEGQGISTTLKSLPHQKISIPMPGKIESLNAALAGGIIIYEWAKNRYNL